MIVGSGALLQVPSIPVACDRLCAFKREGLTCVRVCVWVFLKRSRGVLVVVQNEIHSFAEGIL